MLILEVTAEEMRRMLRIRHNRIDEDLNDLKAAYLSELSLAGVECIPEDNSLARNGLRLYLRWQENYNGEAERYREAYQGVKIAMALAEEYKGGAET